MHPCSLATLSGTRPSSSETPWCWDSQPFGEEDSIINFIVETCPGKKSPSPSLKKKNFGTTAPSSNLKVDLFDNFTISSRNCLRSFFCVFALLTVPTLQKPRRPRSPWPSWHRRHIPNAPWSIFAWTPDDEKHCHHQPFHMIHITTHH